MNVSGLFNPSIPASVQFFTTPSSAEGTWANTIVDPSSPWS